jgi:hypothetical protein
MRQSQAQINGSCSAPSDEGSGTLSHAAFIRRPVTTGTITPKLGSHASHVSQPARMRYSAIHQFFSVANGG